MRFVADLHIHSRYSRACSRDCDLEHLAWWAARKGIGVVGTGDFTHPQWAAELQEKLVPAEPGLYRLRSDLERDVLRTLPPSCRTPVRFALSVEISTIYKRADRTRKVHHLLYAPELATAAELTRRLARIGNLHSDGRPILGLDSRDLLETTLDSGDGTYLVPAHVWTPWFAALGSKSGFDSIADCYADLADAVFAVETGLSSDPAMNWRVSALDRYRLVSNSDAHSPPALGREATLFDTELSYWGIRRALETGDGFAGTLEFFPEEGKYHLDGHRRCEVRLEPAETRRLGGRCPACGSPLTVGVQHRVEALADRPDGARPAGAAPFRCLVSLPQVVGEIRGVGPRSNSVQAEVGRLVERFGPELTILQDVPLDDLASVGSAVLAEAVRRLRRGEVSRVAGYDGEYGVIRLFDPKELADFGGSATLFDLPEPEPAAPDGPVPGTGAGAAPGSVAAAAGPAGSGPAAPAATRLPGPRLPAERPSDLPTQRPVEPPAGRPQPAPPQPAPSQPAPPQRPAPAPGGPGSGRPGSGRPGPGGGDASGPAGSGTAAGGLLAGLDPDQHAAAAAVAGPVLIVAGPGTGKTRTLTRRLAHLIADRGVDPERCLAITFTRRAAEEMAERLTALVPDVAARVLVTTFHGLGVRILRDQADRLGLTSGFRIADDAERIVLLREALGPAAGARDLGRLLAETSRLARAGAAAAPDPELAGVLARYRAGKRARNLVDLDDLLALPVGLLDTDPALAAAYRDRWPEISVDEYQDVDETQYRLLRLLSRPDSRLCAIGDPDQAIYRFRGADVGFFLRFQQDFPAARVVALTRSYRSTPVILQAAVQAVAPSTLVPDRTLEPAAEVPGPSRIVVHSAADERAEAAFVAGAIDRLLGGSSFASLDRGGVEPGHEAVHSFADIAVLYRTDAQARPLVEALDAAGLPYQKRSHHRLADQPGVQEIVAVLRGRAGSGGANSAPRSVLTLVRAAAQAAIDAAGGLPAPASGGIGADAWARLVSGDRTDAGPPAPDDPAARVARISAALELLRPLAERSGADLDRFLADLPLGAEVDLLDPRADRVSLLTLHAAKGLEFPVVFVVGCEDGLLPLRFPGGGRDAEQAQAEIDEERRLFFVGMTRARNALILSAARRRTAYGEAREAAPSRFLADLDPALLDSSSRPVRPRNVQLRLI